METIDVYTFDFFYKSKIDFIKSFTDLEEARSCAYKEAAGWCEDEKPTHWIDKPGKYESYQGNSDYGAILIISKKKGKTT